MIRVLIVQGIVPHYRKPVFNELAKHYDVTVLQSGSPSVGTGDGYREVIAPLESAFSFRFQTGVLGAVCRGGYDVALVMFDIHWITNVLSVFLKGKTRFLYWGHRYSDRGFIDLVKDMLMRLSDGVVLYGDAEVERMVERGIERSRIFVANNTLHVPNHVDASQSDKDSLIFAGRAQARKRVDILIRVFADIITQVPPNITINIVGAGRANDYVRAVASKLGVAHRVVFHGEVLDSNALRPLFERALAYVSPGPVGLGVLHSFAYGVPVVTHLTERHGPEFANLAHGRNALIYRCYEELKEIMLQLCSDRAISARLGRQAYELYASQRTLGQMVESLRMAIDARGAR